MSAVLRTIRRAFSPANPHAFLEHLAAILDTAGPTAPRVDVGTSRAILDKRTPVTVTFTKEFPDAPS